MLSYIVSQVRHRGGRAAVLGLGLLVAAVSFSLLTSAVQTSTARLQGKVSANFRGAYDLLVRPHGARSAVEQRAGLVEPNFLSGIFGGITLAQYAKIQHIPDVQVAAPVAMVGYVMPFVTVPIDVTRDLGSGSNQLLRVQLSWKSDRGLSTYPGGYSYVYVSSAAAVQPACLDSSGASRYLQDAPTVTSPFDPAARSLLSCYQDNQGHITSVGSSPGSGTGGQVATAVAWPVPLLIAAIDPVAEQKLDGLGNAVVSGQYLREGVGATLADLGRGLKARTVPVIAATKPIIDESLSISVSRLPAMSPAQLEQTISTANPQASLGKLAGQQLTSSSINADQAYARLLGTTGSGIPVPNIGNYWTVGPVHYARSGKSLTAVPQANPSGVWTENGFPNDLAIVPMENADVPLRTITEHTGSNEIVGDVPNEPAIRVIGRFNSARLTNFSKLSQLPLGAFLPATAQPADPRTSRLLGGRDLLPSADLAGLINQPPMLLTTLQALPALTNSQYFSPANSAAPISTIRVRVAGVHGADQASLARLRAVATQIEKTTGLDVDVTAGASPAPQTINLPAGRYGRPPLTLTQQWVRKGVAISIVQAVDRKSLTLFVLILLATTCFLANGALSAMRSRREEIGTLLCLGWSRPRIFAATLGELAVTGLVAGGAGAGLAALLITAFGLRLALWYTALIIPVAVLLAVLAGLPPALSATRSSPLDAVRPNVRQPVRASHPRSILALAWSELRRRPGRLTIAAIPLLIGVAALTVLLAINLAFRGTLTGTLLGNAVIAQARGVDTVAVALVIILAAASVADTLAMNLREKSREIAMLQSGGWSDAHLIRYVTYQALAIGIIGTAPGAAAGLAISAAIGGHPALLWVATLIAALAGAVVAVTAGLGPAWYTTRRPLAAVLAEE